MQIEKMTYSVNECATILGISRSKMYAQVRIANEIGTPYKVLKIGTQYRVPCKSFRDYLKMYDMIDDIGKAK